MRMPAKADRHRSRKPNKRPAARTDAVIATIWLVFYLVAMTVAVMSPLHSHAIETAVR